MFKGYTLTRMNTNGKIAAGDIFTTPQQNLKVGMIVVIQNENGESQTTPIIEISLMDGQISITTESNSVYVVKVI